MSKVSLDLSSIKAAGIYTIEIDESQRTETQVSALRLLVGFAGKGPFNRPVFLQTEGQIEKLFGDIDTRLEKKGCFFNRFARTMIDGGPILALNLLKVDDTFEGPDQVNYAALSLDAGKKNPVVTDAGKTYGEVDYLADTVDKEIYGTTTGDVIPFVGKAPYAAMFDRSHFWTPSETNLMNVASIGLGTGGNDSYEKSNFINFANTGTDEISILVYKPENFTGYDITAKEWYGGEENIPYGWIRPSDYISDYFIRVVAVKGNWSNYPILASDSTWGKYFDSKGILKDKIYQFCSADGITFIGSWSGVIIPDFTDNAGNYLYIKDRVNAQTESTGVLMTINEDAMQVLSYDLNGIDLVTGDATGVGAWVYDYDGNGEAESDYGESEIGENGFKIDMVGHGFKDGVKSDTSISILQTSYPSVVFDGSVASADGLKSNSSVWYLDDASNYANVSGLSIETTVKVPTFETGATDRGQSLHLYSVCDVSTNLRIDSDYCYVAMTKNKFNNTSTYTATNSKTIKSMTAYDASGNASTGKISAYVDSAVNVTLKDSLADNTLYTDTSVLFGNYAAYNNTNETLFVFKVQAGTSGSEVTDVTAPTTTATTWTLGSTDTSVLEFRYNGSSYAVNPTDTRIYVEEENTTPSTWGFNFLSYNYVTNASEDVRAYIRDAYYFNGMRNAATSDSSAVDLIETDLFNGTNPVTSDTLNMIVITDEEQAANLTVNDFLDNICSNNNIGEATKYGLIPGITRITKKIFVNLTTDNKFTYSGTKYTFNTNVATPIRTRSGKRGFYLVTTVDPVLINNKNCVIRQLPISDDTISTSLRFIPLRGLAISSRHRPGFDEDGRISINDGISKIYSVLEEDGIQRSLCNYNMVTYRYIVDSMGYGIDEEMGGKVYLSRLAMNRGKCTALLNAPSKHQFEMSSDPCFCDTYDSDQYVKPAMNTKWIAEGGNPDMYATKLFTLPTEDDGSKYTAVFYPHLIYRYNNHNILVPPAADISNTFVRKFTGGDPYAITANMDGQLSNSSMTSVEVDLDTEDRGYLEEKGINPLIRENGVVKIYGNRTAYTDTVSDMQRLHVRENLNTMELAIDAVLRQYNFKYNTATTRAEIITAVTPIMEAMKTSRAIEYYELQCDEENNTEELIMNDFGILDVIVYMSHGMEKLVQRIRLRKLSDMPSE